MRNIILVVSILVSITISGTISKAQNNSDMIVDGNDNAIVATQSTIDSLNKIKLSVKGKRNKLKLDQIQKDVSAPNNKSKETSFISKLKESDNILSPTANIIAILSALIALTIYLYKRIKKKIN